MLIGYCRVSSEDQKLEVQLEQLQAAGCDKIFAEKMSGKEAANRLEFQKAVAFAREGDVFVVTRLDRASRSMSDLVNFILTLQKKGVGFKCVMQSSVDTTTAEGRFMINLLGSFAEFEREIRAARQAEGIKKAKEQGRYRRTKADNETIRRRIVAMKDANPNVTAKEILAQLKSERISISRAMMYKITPGIWTDAPEGIRKAKERKDKLKRLTTPKAVSAER